MKISAYLNRADPENIHLESWKCSDAKRSRKNKLMYSKKSFRNPERIQTLKDPVKMLRCWRRNLKDPEMVSKNPSSDPNVFKNRTKRFFGIQSYGILQEYQRRDSIFEILPGFLDYWKSFPILCESRRSIWREKLTRDPSGIILWGFFLIAGRLLRRRNF